VDPDNRRPIDYDLRQHLLQQLLHDSGARDLRELCDELVANYRDGRAKQWTTTQALCFRRDNPELFQKGSYLSLTAAGEKQEHVVAFLREHQGRVAVVVAPRLIYTLMKGESDGSISEAWGETKISLPVSAPVSFTNIFTGETLEAQGRSLLCRDVFRFFPVALLSGF